MIFSSIISIIKRKISLYYFVKKWRKINEHNNTFPVNKFSIESVIVGKYSYGPLNVFCWGAENEKLIIGNYVSIASSVKFLLGGNHNINTFSTYPFKVKFLGKENEAWSKGPIVVEDDVWIGMNSLILSGVKIGQGSIIGAGSVVAKNIPPYSIAVGNPCKVIRKRFDCAIINELLKINFDNISEKFFKDNRSILSEKLDEKMINQLINEIKKLEK